MSWKPDRYAPLRALLGRERLAEEVDEELALHLELRAADLEAEGLAPVQAREEAARRFGDVTRYRAQLFAIDESAQRERRRMEIRDAVRREARQAVRALVRAPVFAVVAVLTLGLGLGGTTAIYTLIDSIVLRPLPYPEPERLVQLWHAVPRVQEGQRWGNSVASYFHYDEHVTSFESLGAYMGTTYSVSGSGDAERIDGAAVSRSLFQVIGARTAVGRLFSDDEDRPGAEPVAVLGYDLWQSRYRGDPGIVGSTVQLNAAPVTVVGVMAPGVHVPGRETHIWRPLRLDRSAEAVNSHYLATLARLRPGVSVEAAQADVQRHTLRLPELHPGAYGGGFYEQSGFRASVTLLRDEVIGQIDRVLWLLLGAVALVLLIACANVASLFMVRAEARRRETTVRAALGAERAHLAVQYLAESALLALLAGGLGLLLAWAGIRLLVAVGPASLPRLDDVAISTNSVVFTLALAAATALVFGLLPVVRSARADFGALRESGRGTTPSRHRHFVRNALVVGQVALALVLLAAGGLMLRSFANLRAVESGIDVGNVLTFQVMLPFARYEEEASVYRFQREFGDRLGAQPGVQVVGAAANLPLGGGTGCSHTTGENARESGICVPTTLVLPGYFEALRINVRGQTFTWDDMERRTAGAVISRALAERLWPGEDPIGKGIISWQDGPPWFHIVGVADDVLADGLDQPPAQAVYYLTRRPDAEGYYGPDGVRSLTFVARTASAPENLAPAVRSILREMDPEVPLAQVRTMEDVVMQSPKMARTSFTMVLLGVAAGMALFLSAVGLYGVIAYLVGRRRAEIGVRMALGARVAEVARMVVLQSVRLTVAGIVLGLAAALVLMRVLASLVWGVEPTDPLTLLGVSALLLVVAVVAAAVPARRATRTHPVEALRAE